MLVQIVDGGHGELIIQYSFDMDQFFGLINAEVAEAT